MLIVAAGALVDDDGRVLMQRRPANGPEGGLWEFPGGKLEPGETPEAALIRELSEELGIGVGIPALAPVAFATSGRLILLLYGVRRWSGQPAALQAEELGWYRVAQLPDLSMPALDRPLLMPLAEYLAR